MRTRGRLLVWIGPGFFILLLGLSWFAGEAPGSAAERPMVTPGRIVSLAPSVTEVLFALDLDREIVGVTDFCDYPAAALTRPRVGGFKGKSLEAIVALSPDLVIGTRDGNEAWLFPVLKRLQVRALSVQPSTLPGVIESVLVMGRAVGREAEARALAQTLQSRMEAIERRVRAAAPVRVLFVYGRNPLVLAGSGTFADDMIHRAGGVNVAADAGMPYPRFSLETVIARAPEVIVEGAMGREALATRTAAARQYWSRWDSLPAVKSGRIVVLDEDLIARPGPRIFDGLVTLARALHPELFAESGPESGADVVGGVRP